MKRCWRSSSIAWRASRGVPMPRLTIRRLWMLCASPRQPCSVALKPGWHAGSKVRIRSREASRAAQDRRKLKRMQALIDFIGSHATKLLGALTATVSYLNAEQIIPNGQLKYYTAVL